METAVFLVSAVVILAGALGVILSRNPVHSALMLVMTLFGVAVLFVAQEAHFLAVVQVIVYAGAIVVLFLFVIMLLGVDKAETITEPLRGQRVLALIAALATLGLTLVAFLGDDAISGMRSTTAEAAQGAENVAAIARELFTDYVFAFEVTAVLLTIAVIGAVVMARMPRSVDADEGGEAE